MVLLVRVEIKRERDRGTIETFSTIASSLEKLKIGLNLGHLPRKDSLS